MYVINVGRHIVTAVQGENTNTSIHVRSRSPKCVINVGRRLFRQVISQNTSSFIKVRSPLFAINVERHENLDGQVISESINLTTQVRSPMCVINVDRYLFWHTVFQDIHCKLTHSHDKSCVCIYCGVWGRRSVWQTIVSRQVRSHIGVCD